MEQEERHIGTKYQCNETDLQRYGSDLVKILKLSDERKRTRTEFRTAKLKYDEAWTALANEKQLLDEIFAGLGQEESEIINDRNWLITQIKSMSAYRCTVWC